MIKTLLLLLSFTFLQAFQLYAQNVGIGITTPDQSAIVDMSANNKGLLIPRISTSGITAINNPAKGLMVYDSSKNQLMINMGTAAVPNWQTSITGSGWGLSGNSGTNPASQFIGNVDNQPLRFRINNINAGELHPGSGNIFWGLRAGQSNTLAHGNIAMGTDALKLNTFKSNLVAIGDSALFNNGIGVTSTFAYGIGNTAIGSKALYANTTGQDNTATGYQALLSNIDGFSNTANGTGSLSANTNGNSNVGIGDYTLQKNTTGNSNTSVGSNAMYSNNSGTGNTATGAFALGQNTVGYKNTVSGWEALYTNISGSNNTAFGAFTLNYNNTGNGNTATGTEALETNVTGDYNTADGYQALGLNYAGQKNTALGYQALRGNKGSLGSYNTAIGSTALWATSNSQYNVAIGYNAGSTYDNGYNNVFVGANTDVNGAGYYNVIAIGQGTIVGGSSVARFGNSATVSYGGWANWSNVSDGRLKKDVRENVSGLDFILKLRPVTYHLSLTDNAQLLRTAQAKISDDKMQAAIKQKEQILYSGFIAQEVEKAAGDLGYDFSGVDKPRSDNDFYGLRYADFVVPLVKAVQEQQQLMDQMKKRIDALEQQNKLLQQLISNKK